MATARNHTRGTALVVMPQHFHYSGHGLDPWVGAKVSLTMRCSQKKEEKQKHTSLFVERAAVMWEAGSYT